MHLTDEQLNEYLDRETDDRAQIESHLAVCADCRARLRALETLFSEIASLPELEFVPGSVTRPAPIYSQPARLPRSLAVTLTAQAVLAALTTILAAPFVLQPVVSYAPSFSMPSFIDVFLQIQSLWTGWLDTLATLSFPAVPAIPVLDTSSLFVMLAVLGVSLLWLVGNGLLLRDQSNANQENLHV